MRLGWTMGAVCLLIGLNANAALLHTNASGDGGVSSLFLTVWDGTSKSIVIDLNVNALSTDFNTFSFDQNFASQLGSAFPTGTGSDFQYSVVAASVAAQNSGIWTTHSSSTLTSYDTVTNGTAISGALANYANNNPLASLGLGQTNAPDGVTSGPGYYGGNNFNGTLGGKVPADMGGSIGTALNFYSLLKQFQSTKFVANNTLYSGQWLLSATGELTYSAVPLPAGIYLLGAALLGLVGVGRRARVANAA